MTNEPTSHHRPLAYLEAEAEEIRLLCVQCDSVLYCSLHHLLHVLSILLITAPACTQAHRDGAQH